MKVQHIPSADGSSDHYVPYGAKTTAAVSGATNCAYDALACQTDKVGSGAALREQVADRLTTSTNTAALHKATERLRAHNPRALREGGGLHAATMYMRQKDPHDFHNRLLLSSDKDYRALEKQQQKADKRGDETKSKELAAQLREMEVKAFAARKERECKMAGYVLQLGAGIGAGAAAAPLGPFAAYAAGVGAFSGLGIGLDSEIHADIKAGNWSGALNHLSYHLPFVGAGRNSWDAWQMGKPWSAAGHAGLFGAEVFGLRGVGLRGAPRGLGAGGAGKVRGTVRKRVGTKRAGKAAKAAKGEEGGAKGEVNKSPSLQSWKVSTWNIGEGAVNKPHHNWHKIFGNQKPNLKQVEPYIKEALSKGKWKDTGLIKGEKGIIIGTKVELLSQVGNNKIWVLGMRTADGELIINNAGVK